MAVRLDRGWRDRIAADAGLDDRTRVPVHALRQQHPRLRQCRPDVPVEYVPPESAPDLELSARRRPEAGQQLSVCVRAGGGSLQRARADDVRLAVLSKDAISL